MVTYLEREKSTINHMAVWVMEEDDVLSQIVIENKDGYAYVNQ